MSSLWLFNVWVWGSGALTQNPGTHQFLDNSIFGSRNQFNSVRENGTPELRGFLRGFCSREGTAFGQQLQ